MIPVFLLVAITSQTVDGRLDVDNNLGFKVLVWIYLILVPTCYCVLAWAAVVDDIFLR